MKTSMLKNNLDFPLKSNSITNSHSQSPSFLFHDVFNSNSTCQPPEFQVSDIEMITIQSLSYTSLKDLLPASPSPSIISPTHNSSWYEIPIRNPLVKHAALAYLQPMSTPTEVDKGLFGKLKDKCCLFCCGGGGFGCFGWLADVFFATVKVVFGGLRDRSSGFENGDEDDDAEEDDDDEEDEKVKVD